MRSKAQSRFLRPSSRIHLILCSAGLAALATAMPALSQTTTTVCPPGSQSCAITTQSIGDTSNPSSAEGTSSISSQSGTSSASNTSASDININPTIDPSVQQNSTNTTEGTITGGNVTGGNVTGGNVTGGNTTSTAQGGTSTGNTTSANNQSSATSGDSSATTGVNNGSLTNSNSTGASSAAVGNTSTGASTSTANGGTTSSAGGSSTANGGTNTANGGTTTSAGGSGGAGGVSNATTGSLTGGTNSTSNVNTTGASGASNSSTNVDLSDRSVNSNNQRWTFIPPVVPPTPPSTLAVGNIVSETGACGVLQRVVREPVDGSFFGFFAKTTVRQGFTDRLVPLLDERGLQQDYRRVPLEDGSGYRLFGHQVTQHTTVIGVAGSRNFALGGGGGGGGWGQAGAGGSSSMQQMVTAIQLRDCEVGSIVNPRPVVYVEPARIRR